MTEDEIRRTLEELSVPVSEQELQEIAEWTAHVREGVAGLQQLPLHEEEPAWPPSAEEGP